jgi:hypothetical protein
VLLRVRLLLLLLLLLYFFFYPCALGAHVHTRTHVFHRVLYRCARTQVYGDLIAGDSELRAALGRVRPIARDSWAALQALMQQNLCLIGYFSGIQ